jgi:hypothetical protein
MLVGRCVICFLRQFLGYSVTDSKHMNPSQQKRKKGARARLRIYVLWLSLHLCRNLSILPVICSLITAESCSFVKAETSSLASYSWGPRFESRPRDRLPLDLLMLDLRFSYRWLWIVYLMGCNAVSSGRSLSTFRRDVLLPCQSARYLFCSRSWRWR